MTRLGILSVLLCATLPCAVIAQTTTTSRVSTSIPGFSLVSADAEAFSFSIDPSTGIAEENSTVVYETNQAERTVNVHVEGDLAGLEVRVEPMIGARQVLGSAVSGTAGDAAPVVFQNAGTRPLVMNVTGVGAEMGVRYTVVALAPEAAARAHDLRIYYTID